MKYICNTYLLHAYQSSIVRIGLADFTLQASKTGEGQVRLGEDSEVVFAQLLAFVVKP